MGRKNLLDHIFGLREDLQAYLEARMSYYGLTAFEKAVRLLTTFLGNGVIIVTLLIALIFLSGAGAVYISTLLDSYVLGLLVTGSFYLLLAIILMLFRNRIFSRFVIKSLSDVFFRDDDEQPK